MQRRKVQRIRNDCNKYIISHLILSEHLLLRTESKPVIEGKDVKYSVPTAK